MKKSLLLFLIFSFFLINTINSQTHPPKGAAADKAITAYSAGNLDDLSSALPALVKEYPNHPFTIFFKAFIADRKDNNVNEALRGYSEVIKTAPDLMEPSSQRGFHNQLFNISGSLRETPLPNAAQPSYCHSINL